MPGNELSADGDWKAVETAINRQMKKLDMSLAGLSRESGISQTTIRYIGRPEKRQKSTLVALSAALRCRHDFLLDVWSHKADPHDSSPVETVFFEGMLRTEVDPLKTEMAILRDMVHEINGKITLLLNRRHEE